jgi:hypothetical protein
MGRKHQNGGVVGKRRIYYDGLNTGVHDLQTVYDSFSGSPTNREGYNRGLGTTQSLYTFTTFTFTHAGQTGRLAGTLANFQSAYSAETWTQNTDYFNVVDRGFQRWVVPADGNYSFEVAGAQGGGGGGYGAIVTFDMDLNQTDELLITVGHRGVNTGGTYRPSGGGGCSGVYTNTQLNDTESSSNFIIAIAGGGGGRSIGSSSGLVTGMHGNASTSGYSGQSASAWRNTTGGTGGNGSTGGGGFGGGGPGAGYLTNGADTSNSYGFSKGNGWEGGNQRTTGQETCTGSFGGAGGASVNGSNYRGGGGGGGYSGGGAGVGSGSGSAGRGGGGGSFCVANGSQSMTMITGGASASVSRTISNRTITGGTTTGTNGNNLTAGDNSGAANGYVTVTFNG